MKFDFPMLFLLAAIGLRSKTMDWRRWFFVSLLVSVWMVYNWLKA